LKKAFDIYCKKLCKYLHKWAKLSKTPIAITQEFLMNFGHLLQRSKEHKLTSEMEPVLDALWNINKEVQEYAYPEPRISNGTNLNMVRKVRFAIKKLLFLNYNNLLSLIVIIIQTSNKLKNQKGLESSLYPVPSQL
jgi:hypothetical protein